MDIKIIFLNRPINKGNELILSSPWLIQVAKSRDEVEPMETLNHPANTIRISRWRWEKNLWKHKIPNPSSTALTPTHIHPHLLTSTHTYSHPRTKHMLFFDRSPVTDGRPPSFMTKNRSPSLSISMHAHGKPKNGTKLPPIREGDVCSSNWNLSGIKTPQCVMDKRAERLGG